MNCNVCNHSEKTKIDILHPVFNHYNFLKMSNALALFCCNNCKFITIIKEEEHQVKAIYLNDDYFKTKPTHYISFKEISEKSNDNMVSVYKSRAECLKNFFTNDNPYVLDIGCLDGKMLIEIQNIFPDAQLYGYDINPNIGSIFPDKKNFFFCTGNISKVNKTFDAIIMSNVIQYLPDSKELLLQLKTLLKPEGFIYIEVVDITKNPIAILYGDQFSYYSEPILKNLLKLSGYNFFSLNNTWATRDLSCIAKVSTVEKNFELEKDDSIQECIEYLNTIENKLKQIKHSNLKVLGTTINAAFINSIIGDKVSSFIDEHPKKIGQYFYDKKIIHPSELTDSDIVLISYKDSGNKIKERLSHQYNGEYVLL